MYRYISTYLHLHLHRHQHLQLYTYTYTCTYTCTYTYTYTYTYTHTHTNTAASSQTYLWSYIYMHISHAKPHRQPTPNTARPAPGSPFSATHARPGFCTATPAPLPPWPLAFPGGPGLGLCIFLVPRAQLPIGLHPYFSMTKMEGIRPGHILFGPEICPRLRIWGLFGMIPSFWCGI
jgi:hypothetical protein